MPPGAPISFLTLPREIRDEILFHAVLSPRLPPEISLPLYSTSPATPFNIGCAPRRCTFPGKHTQDTTRYEKGAVFNPALPLLLTNQQIHNETLSVLNRVANLPSSNKYILDVILGNELDLYPTWLYVPPLLGTLMSSSRPIGAATEEKRLTLPGSLKKVDSVRAYFRIAGIKKPDHESLRRYTWNYAIWYGEPPRVGWMFYELLERFVRLGPGTNLVNENEETDFGIVINCLEIDFLSPTFNGPELDVDRRDQENNLKPSRSGTSGYYPNDMLRSECLMDVIVIYISRLLFMDSHVADYGAMLFERIGRIKVAKDGVTTHEFNLAETLKNLYQDNVFRYISREDRPEYFRMWKRRTLKMRRELGLPVAFPNDWVEQMEPFEIRDKQNGGPKWHPLYGGPSGASRHRTRRTV